MRKLPVYLLLDTSGSMTGEPIEAVKNGVQMLASALRTDPYALETAYLSIITFNTKPEQIVPLTDLTQFQAPEIKAGGITCLGEALEFLAIRRDEEVTQTTMETKGDWQPLAFILTDGAPTDDWRKGLEEFKKRKWGLVVPVAVGSQVDEKVLRAINPEFIKLDTADSATIKAFFKWVSASVSANSKSVEATGKELPDLSKLPPPPEEISVVV